VISRNLKNKKEIKGDNAKGNEDEEEEDDLEAMKRLAKERY
jgi:hypothetical protein